MENQRFSLRDTSLGLSLRVHEREQNFSSSISTQTTHVSTNEYRLTRQTCPGISSVPTLILTSGVDGRTSSWRPRRLTVCTPRPPCSLENGPPSLRRPGRLFSSTGTPFRGLLRGSRRNSRRPTRPTSSRPSGSSLPPKPLGPPRRNLRDCGRSRPQRPTRSDSYRSRRHRRRQNLGDCRQRLQGCRHCLRGRSALRLLHPRSHPPRQGSSVGCPGGQRHEDPPLCRGWSLS